MKVILEPWKDNLSGRNMRVLGGIQLVSVPPRLFMLQVPAQAASFSLEARVRFLQDGLEDKILSIE